ncbi:MAG: ribosome biogenesis GTPase Der [Limnochordia bacterium]|jgi:GTP-binding protein|nr:ribosome biogenesis GTPase Der [Bacillota bacterium]NLH31192.1 ribosome biogenesis GTPase Der [Bacillota bacterium]HOB07899.1 ribosome biogenesis GTPase Der [Limnochordia bacterium]HPZ29948.1 ribosome biogenesis GTPase Der [Limnochordia bacterium]HQD70356.1 ribosome biogenesis GTPase Der [Limnochordia bacterium]
MSKPMVAIVGRTNVGKSTLFNRIARERIAIVDDQPGVTRDRIYCEVEWLTRKFILVDTGGIETGEDTITRQIRAQAQMAIDEADVIIFVVDGREGLTAADEEIAMQLRKTSKKVILCVNKVEDFSESTAIAAEFWALGLGEPLPVSAEHGRGIGDLLDQVISGFPEDRSLEESDAIKIAVAGRPNVGKSTLINQFVGEERVIVSDIPGTTRDAVDTSFTYNGQEFVLIDTAGMRRKTKIDTGVEHYSVLRALRAVDRSDVVFLMLDAREGVTEQDQRIAGYVHENGKGCAVVVNKWDLVEKDTNTMREYEEEIRDRLQFLPYAPVEFVSALTGKRVHRLLDLAVSIAQQRSMRIPTGRLNEIIQDAVAMHQPPSDKGVRLKIFYAAQVQVNPPVFVIHVNHSQLMHFSYLRYLENCLRAEYGFQGTPIILRVKERT